MTIEGLIFSLSPSSPFPFFPSAPLRRESFLPLPCLAAFFDEMLAQRPRNNNSSPA